MPKAVVLLPGILGSQLYKGKELIWPGTTREYFFGYSEDRFRQILDPDLEPRGIIETYYLDQYIDIIRSLTEMGFALVEKPEQMDPEKNHLYILAYDWRKDNREAARHLANVVDGMRKIAGLEITLLCHSMGGLVARYYLESKELETRGGLKKVAKVIFMGTPHQGAPKALGYIFGKSSNLWLSRNQVRRLAAHGEFNSVYQLLPTSGFHFLRSWVRFLDIYRDDLCVKSDGAEAKLDGEKLADARNFHEALDHRKLLNSSVSVFCFYSSHHDTETLLRYESGDFAAQKIAPSGDGTVPVLSACLPGSPNMAVENEHSKIYASKGLLRELPALLGDEFRFKVCAEALGVTLSNPYLAMGGKLQGVVHVHRDIAAAGKDWKARLEIHAVTGEGQRQATGLGKTIAVSGATVAQVSFELDSSALEPGDYQIVCDASLKGEDAENYITESNTRFVVLKERA